MAKHISKKETERVKKLPLDELNLNEIVYLQRLKIEELEKKVAILIEIHTEPEELT